MTSETSESQKELELRELQDEVNAKQKFVSKLEYLTNAAKLSGRSPLDISKEQKQLERAAGRLQFFEYMDYELFDDAKYTLDEKRRFVGNHLRHDIANIANDRTWEQAFGNKIIAGAILENGGIEAPDTLAVISAREQSFGQAETVSTPDALKRFLDRNASAPLFCKAADASLSAGIFRIDRHDDGHVYLHGHDPVSYSDLFTDFISDESYLVQRNLTNHPAMLPYVTALSCVRLFNLWTDDVLTTPVAVLRLAQGDSISDIRRFDGNLACDIDPKTGEVMSLVSFGTSTERLDDHPTVSGLVGMTLPHWDALLEMNRRVAHLTRPMRMQSPDYALTEDGPVCVEVNARGGFVVLQESTMRGLMTEEFGAFLRSLGMDPEAIAPKPGWFRSKKR
ncbi:MAG: sugar-transfer associated ATP-grasp domain-containing protein [Pseudomonadota bacterium]